LTSWSIELLLNLKKQWIIESYKLALFKKAYFSFKSIFRNLYRAIFAKITVAIGVIVPS